MLETTGARSGRLRTLPVLAFEAEEDLVVVASNYGQARHRGWYHNLKANPRGRVTVNGVTREIEATVVTDPAERERLFAKISRAVIVFGAYRRHTDRMGREIPILRLRPVAHAPSSDEPLPVDLLLFEPLLHRDRRVAVELGANGEAQ